LSGDPAQELYMTHHTPIPASVLVGFLGAGKTTLINQILSGLHGRKIAVVVNEFGAINVDARLVRHTTERMIEMSNGCICCTLRDDLLQELRDLSKIPGLDYILIESTGIGEPLPIAQTFHMADLPALVRLDSIITVVDSANFWQSYHDEGEIEDDEGNAVVEALAPLLVDQIEFTNIVILNKVDITEGWAVVELEQFVRSLNPAALIYRAQHGQIDPARLINTGLYNYDEAEDADDWEAEWAKPSSEVEEYGFTSVVYRAEEPLSWAAFTDLCANDWPQSVLRAKGVVAFADHDPVIVHQAGTSIMLEVLTDDQDDPAQNDDQASDLEEAEVEQTELVLIGRGLRKAELVARLDACRALVQIAI
jgi:G3E family GTPase